MKLLVGLLILLAAGPARAGDGFVLTQWGRWTQAEAVRALDDAVRVGARHVTLLMTLCQPDLKASAIDWCEDAPGTPLRESYQRRRLEALVPELRARGMSLGFIPFPMPPGGKGRQWIWPKDRAAWFRSYGDRVVELAELARELDDSGGVRVTDLVVASELTLLFTLEREWRDLIARVRPVYGGHLTISPVFAQYPLIRFWDALDSIGVSAYFPLVPFGWKFHRAHLLSYARHRRKPLTMVEVGYPNTNVAASMPWDFDFPKRRLDTEKARKCWASFSETWGDEPELRSFWIWGLSAQAGEPEMGFSPIGKPSEAVVKALFEKRAHPEP